MSATTVLLTRSAGDVRVNLLPVEYLQRRRTRRLGWLTAAALLVFILLLAGLYWLKRQDVEQARAERDDARAQVAVLEGRVAELRPFAQLAADLDSGNKLLTAAMSSHVSWSRNLNDLAVRLPRDASLRTLTAGVGAGSAAAATTTESTTTEEPTTTAPLTPTDADALGTVAFTGYSTSRYAPGVQTVLTDLEKVRGYADVYLSTTAKEIAGGTTIHNFTVAATLTDEALSGRFDDGLPAEEER